MKASTKKALVGILISLSVPAAECFIICGGVNSRSSAHQRPGGDRCSSRPLQHLQASRAALEARRSIEEAGMSPLAASREGTSVARRGVGLASSSSSSRLRHDFRLPAASQEQEESQEELEGEYEDGEFEDGEDGAEEFEDYDDDGDAEEYGEGGEEEEEEEEEEAVKEKFVPKSKFDALFGHDGSYDPFDDLPPEEEFNPAIVSEEELKDRREMIGPHTRSKMNPFELYSDWVDHDIGMGNVDEKKKEAIQPMMSVIERVCELIDTTDDIFQFKYTGVIVHQRGIQAWAKSLIKEVYPDVKDVILVTNRTMDRIDAL